jgi:hypothetical protein
LHTSVSSSSSHPGGKGYPFAIRCFLTEDARSFHERDRNCTPLAGSVYLNPPDGTIDLLTKDILMEFFIYYSKFVAYAFEAYYFKLLICWYCLFAFGWVFLKTKLDWGYVTSPLVQTSVIMIVAVAIPLPFLFSSWVTGDFIIPK